MRDLLNVIIGTIPGLPLQGAWVVLLALAILGGVAVYDAKTARVPDEPLFFGLIVLLGAFGGYLDWVPASHKLMIGMACAVFLWGVNELYFKIRRHDAFGLGDVKWTLLAATVFGARASFIAWVLGSWIAVLFMGGLFLYRKSTEKGEVAFPKRVHFVPFLFIGLLLAVFGKL